MGKHLWALKKPKDMIKTAAEYGKEADVELRFWRTAWRTAAFNEAVRVANNLDDLLSVIEYELCQSDVEFFVNVLKKPNHQEATKLILDEMVTMRKTLEVFIHEDESPIECFLQNQSNARQCRKVINGIIESCIEEAKTAVSQVTEGASSTNTRRRSSVTTE